MIQWVDRIRVPKVTMSRDTNQLDHQLEQLLSRRVRDNGIQEFSSPQQKDKKGNKEENHVRIQVSPQSRSHWPRQLQRAACLPRYR